MSELTNAIKQICEEKNLDYDSVIKTIELALAAAYRKDFSERNQNIRVSFDPKTAASQVYDVKEVVENLTAEEEKELFERLNNPNYRKDEEKEKPQKKEEGVIAEEKEKRFNPRTEIQLKEALIMKHNAKIGDEIVTELPVPESYGRMAAQTAKQVIIQKLREMERDMVLEEFKDKEHEVVAGVVQHREGRMVFVDLGKAVGILPSEEQIYDERYYPGERIKVFVKEVKEGKRGPEIILSRRSEEILRKVFYLEIPEISNGLVEIKAIAREAGSRSKVAIHTDAENVDPVGSCVGQRGTRIQTIIKELGGEKVDIIEYNENVAQFIANALAPAKVLSIELNEEEQKAIVRVSSDKLSLAIGKNGQNVRLAAHLTGWKIDILEAGDDGDKELVNSEEESSGETEDAKLDQVKEKKELEKKEEVKEEKEEKKEEVKEEKEEKKEEVKEEKEEKKEEVKEEKEEKKEGDKK